jgi:hypothetical protein
MVAVLRNNDDVDSTHWPTRTHDLLTAAGAASTVVDRVVRRFQVAHVYVESLTGVGLTRRGLRLDPGQGHCFVVITATTTQPTEDSDSSAGGVR